MKINVRKKMYSLILLGSTLLLTSCGSKENQPNALEEAARTGEVIDIGEGSLEVVDNDQIVEAVKEVEPVVVHTLDEITYSDNSYLITKTKIDVTDVDNEIVGNINMREIINNYNTVDSNTYLVEYNGIRGFISNDDNIELIEKSMVSNEVIKSGYLNKDTVVTFEDESFIEVPMYEFVKVYFENENNYIVNVDGVVGYLNKEDIDLLKDTYAVVDISDQRASIYENGEKIYDAPVITGMANTKNATPIGIYSIGEGYMNYSDGRWLKNENGSNNVWVDYMVRFNGGIGFHDCDYHYDEDTGMSHGWRSPSEFTVDRYEWDGSHGCVNMLNEDAKAVYDNLKPNDSVLVKK